MTSPLGKPAVRKITPCWAVLSLLIPALLAQEQMELLAGQPWARVLYTTRLAPDDFTKAGARIRPLDLDRLPENQAVVLCGSPDSSALPIVRTASESCHSLWKSGNVRP